MGNKVNSRILTGRLTGCPQESLLGDIHAGNSGTGNQQHTLVIGRLNSRFREGFSHCHNAHQRRAAHGLVGIDMKPLLHLCITEFHLTYWQLMMSRRQEAHLTNARPAGYKRRSHRSTVIANGTDNALTCYDYRITLHLNHSLPFTPLVSTITSYGS
jgi:hypothetical protein